MRVPLPKANWIITYVPELDGVVRRRRKAMGAMLIQYNGPARQMQ